MISRVQLEQVLVSALEKLYKNDHFLISEDVNERSISFKLAGYLQGEMDQIENGWNVDCEYNRIGTSKVEGEFLTKRMDLPSRNNVSSEDTKATTVFPDINIHHRGLEGSEHNLMVVEMKKNKPEDQFDFVKLEQYGKSLNYQWGVYLSLSVDSYELTWWEYGVRVKT